MIQLSSSVRNLIGNTPLLRLSGLEKQQGITGSILAKSEFFNPGGSVKDRIALAMIEDGERRRVITPGTTIIEPTSGNTGIGLAAVGASKGLQVILVMPDTMSIERRSLLKAYGARLVLTEGSKGMKGAIAKSLELAAEIPDSFIPGQFSNPQNPGVHYKTTGPEIFEATGGRLDAFVAGVGTGGTITGAGQYLKEKIPGIKVYAVEPQESPILSGGVHSPHKIQGIGAGFVPEVLNTKIYDDVITVSGDRAYEYAREVAKTDGLLVGISSGAALCAAIRVANLPEFKGKDPRIAVILPDTGERYLSTDLFDK